jgi:anti-sigma regulatory factor (Ser/Thr protein kinase)
MGAITAAVNRDLDADVTYVDLEGRLALGTSSQVRSLLLKCIAECPTAVVVDVTGCTVETGAALTVFPAVALHQDRQPWVALLVCGGDDTFHRASARAVLGPVPTYPSRADALRAVEDVRARQQRLTLRLPPTMDAPDEARRAVKDACDRWGVPDIVPAATLVMSELVTNAVLHARTEVVVETAIRGSYLHVRVRDGSVEPPVLSDEPSDPPRDHGRGLPIVAVHSAAWGYVLNPDGAGKLVWATLRFAPSGAGKPGQRGTDVRKPR